MYRHQLKVRERKWMQQRSTYQSKKVQFEQEVDLSNIAAQRAYTRTQIELNNAKSLAILENQEDFKKMLQNEGAIESSAAERGIRGNAVARMLVMNKGNFGVSQALRSRGLAQARYAAKESMADVNRNLKSQLNQSFSKVAIAPVVDFKPPEPYYASPGLALMAGMANAISEGVGGAQGTKTNWSSNSLGSTPSGFYSSPGQMSFGQSMSTSLGAGGSSYMNYNPGIRFNYNTGVNFMSGAL